MVFELKDGVRLLMRAACSLYKAGAAFCMPSASKVTESPKSGGSYQQQSILVRMY